MKKCGGCKQDKPISDFYQGKSGKAEGWCKPCNTIRCREYQRANKEKVNSRMRKNRPRNKYKIPHDKYSQMISQGCLICGTTEGRLVIDHDHSCCLGERTCGVCVRGVLCHRHNVVLGMVNDSVEELEALKLYLDAHSKA